MSMTFSGSDQVGAYQALVIASALSLYAATGMQANRAYTPKAMMRTAEALTGLKFKPRAYLVAADALRDLAGVPARHRG